MKGAIPAGNLRTFAQQFIFASILASIFLFFAASMPMHAAAQTIGSSQTSQLLPPGQNTCQTLTVSDIQPHVYGGFLESFDVTISDNSYVSILGTAGTASIPLQYMSRWTAIPGGVRIHVDTPTTAVGNSLPVSLTLLSAASGKPVCISVISFNVGASSSVSANQAPEPISQVLLNGGHGTGSTGSSSATGNAVKSLSGAGSATGKIVTTHPLGSTSATTNVSSSSASQSVVAATAFSGLGTICASGNAYRLWFILLIIYLIILAVVIFTEPWFLEQSVLGATAAILVPLILLLAFWYFSEACRAASWIPVVACIIAIVGLFLAFREYETTPVTLP
jgi:hypothetical protein